MFSFSCKGFDLLWNLMNLLITFFSQTSAIGLLFLWVFINQTLNKYIIIEPPLWVLNLTVFCYILLYMYIPLRICKKSIIKIKLQWDQVLYDDHYTVLVCKISFFPKHNVLPLAKIYYIIIC
jgi:hypothetical protein